MTGNTRSKFAAAIIGSAALITAGKLGMSDAVVIPIGILWCSIGAGHAAIDYYKAKGSANLPPAPTGK